MIALLDGEDADLIRSLLALHSEVGDGPRHKRAGELHNALFPGRPLPGVATTDARVADVARALRKAETALSEGQENCIGVADPSADSETVWSEPLRLIRDLMKRAGVEPEFAYGSEAGR